VFFSAVHANGYGCLHEKRLQMVLPYLRLGYDFFKLKGSFFHPSFQFFENLLQGLRG
jgi:hypothetical protein